MRWLEDDFDTAGLRQIYDARRAGLREWLINSRIDW